MLEKVDRGGGVLRDVGHLIEVVARQEGIGVRIVEPRGGEAFPCRESERNVVADFSGEPHALAFR